MKEESRQETNQNALASRVKLEEQDREREARKQVNQTLKNNWQKDQQAMLDDLSPEDQNILKELSRVEYDLDHGLDRSYENVFQNQLLRDSYRKSLDVHGIRGKDLEDMVRYLQKRQEEQEEQEERLEQEKREARKQAKQTLKENWWKDQQAMLDDLSPEDQNILKELSRVEYDLHHTLDASNDEIIQNQLLRNSYRKSLDVHGIRGKDLEEMVRYLQMLENEQRDLQAQQERRDFADDGFLQGTGASVMSIPENAVGRVLGTIDMGLQYLERKFNRSYAPLDMHTSIQSISNQAQAGRQEVGSNINEWAAKATGNELVGNVMEILYNSVMDTADALVITPLGEKGAMVVSGVAGINDSFRQAKSQGALDDEAITYAVLNQGLKSLMDRIGLKETKRVLEQNRKSFQNMLMWQLEKINFAGAGAALNQLVENWLENIIFSDNSRLNEAYDVAYQTAMDEGADITQAQAAGDNAQRSYMLSSAIAAQVEGMRNSGMETIIKTLQ